MKKLVYIFIIMVTMLACSEPHERTAALEHAIATMRNNPDSALRILDSLKENEQEFGRHFRMLCRLHRMNALNKLDTLFRSTEEAQQLADYFDGHGTPNEKMLAHYLLGRAYYDTGESPMALRCFQDAVAMADTTDADCDYWQLSRVYGQISNIFYHQNLWKDDFASTEQEIKYAWRSKDTLNALLAISGKIRIHERLSTVDSAIYVCEHVSELFNKYGYKKHSAAVRASIIKDLIDNGHLAKAKRNMDIYESESGFFNADGDIEPGREVYYYFKGLYYLAINQYDSAEYYFRKELRDGKDFNNQNAASRGLALLFQQTNRSDSASKYALYSYDMNDSAYAHMATEEVANIHGLYNYIHNQEIAQKEKEKNVAEHNKVRWLACFLLIIMLAGIYYIRNTRKKRKEMSRKYHKSVTAIAYLQSEITKLTNKKSYLDKLLADERSEHLEITRMSENNALALRQAKFDVEMLSHNVGELHQMIVEKENMIIKLQSELQAKYKSGNLERDLTNERLIRHKSYPLLHELSSKGIIPDDSQWQELKKMAAEVYPRFYEFISSKSLKEKEFYTCMLLRMLVKPKAIANMLGVTQSYISKIRSEMLFRLFNVTGTSREFDKKIMEIV